MFGFFEKSNEDKNFKATIKGILGSRAKNIDLYRLAIRHSSVSGDSNERLEYLGDAILGAVVADFLFAKFPYRDEGFLTEMRSRIVKRDSLNALAEKIGLSKIIEFNFGKGIAVKKTIYGNALEAFIGAVYLDKGYHFTFQFILNSLIRPHIDIQDLIDNDRNFKSQLIEWSQKDGKKVVFQIASEDGEKHNRTFNAQVILDDEIIASGLGHSKKKAEQAAAEKACLTLGIVVAAE